MRKCNFGKLKGKCDVHRVGSSSLKMHDEEKLLKEFNVNSGDKMLDLGCGPGDYSLRLSEIVGEEGRIFSIDRNEEVIGYLRERISKIGITNIETHISDITKNLPLEDNSIDVCIIITVLHILNIKQTGSEFFGELKRILKPGGRLITIDVKKDVTGFGPPQAMRLDPNEISQVASKVGFVQKRLLDLGHTYLLEFGVNG